MIRHAFLAVLLLCAGQMTEEQKHFVIAKAKKDLHSGDRLKAQNAGFALSRFKEGRAVLAGAIGEFGKKRRAAPDDDYTRACWLAFVRAYCQEVGSPRGSVAEIPDNLIPEIVSELSISKEGGPSVYDRIRLLEMLGSRARAAAPVLEWIRDHGDEQNSLAAVRALKAVMGK